MAAASSPTFPPPATDVAAPGVPDLSIPYDLATRGQWQALFSHLSHPAHTPHPHHRLLLSALSALCLAKLRRFPDAAALLASLHPDPACPPPPFLIRLLHALLPLFLPDRPLALDRLYTLLSSVRARPNAGHPEWRRRDALVASVLAADHLAHREFDVALALLADIAGRDPGNPVLLSRLAYAHLQIGNLGAASAAFRHVESVAAASEDPTRHANLLARNRALECIVGKDYAAAVREYERCIEADPADAVALNNKALCLMYSRDPGDRKSVV